MRGLTVCIRVFLLALCFAVPRIHAGAAERMLQERYHAALNTMTQEVKQAPDPAAKRAVLERFLGHMQSGLGQAENLSGLNDAAGRFGLAASGVSGFDGPGRPAGKGYQPMAIISALGLAHSAKAAISAASS